MLRVDLIESSLFCLVHHSSILCIFIFHSDTLLFLLIVLRNLITMSLPSGACAIHIRLRFELDSFLLGHLLVPSACRSQSRPLLLLLNFSDDSVGLCDLLGLFGLEHASLATVCSPRVKADYFDLRIVLLVSHIVIQI